MQRLLIIAISILWTCSLFAQDITGQWYGALTVQGSETRLIVNIRKSDGIYTATLDSPDQGAKGLPINSISFEDNQLSFSMNDQNARYTGKFSNGVFEGTWTQGPGSFPLKFGREAIEKKEQVRPQEPVKPYPYNEEEVFFENSNAGVKLAGTLTLPKTGGPHPAVILISGSGPQNRDEELAGHKPFRVLADYLTRQGLAVLRYDDRGTAQSTGDFSTATTADLATDAQSALAFLASRDDVDKNRIGLMGHSEGGIIAPIVAAQSELTAFIVLLAGTGIPGDELLLIQSEAIATAQGVSGPFLDRTLQINKGAFDIVKNASDDTDLEAVLSAYILEQVPEAYRPQNMTEEAFAKSQTSQLLSPWMQYFIRYNPALVLEDLDCPVLAVNGDKDLQVPSKVNLEAIEKALKKGGNSQITTIEFPNLNHLFQTTTTGLPSEYGTIEETFSEEVMEKVTTWIKNTLKQ